MIIGSHVQMKAPKYMVGAVEEALSYDANAFMLYTGAPQNTRRAEVEKLRIPEAKTLMEEHGMSMDHLIIHAPYIINPANSVKEEVGELAVSFLQKELERTKAIGAKYIVLHPGSFTTTDLETGIATIVRHLNEVDVPEGIVICLETMAGKGSEVGFRFEHLAEIISQLNQKERYGVCFDTCHVSDAGYDLTNFDAVLDEFERVIGLDRLHVIHLNDSKNPMGARKDRHENIGYGTIGFDVLSTIAHHEKLKDVPKILETPYVDAKAPYKEEIAMLRENAFNDYRTNKAEGK